MTILTLTALLAAFWLMSLGVYICLLNAPIQRTK